MGAGLASPLAGIIGRSLVATETTRDQTLSAPLIGRSDRDAMLSARVAAGDPGVLRAIWDAYEPGVRRYVRKTFGPDLDPQDLVQDVFLEVFRRLTSLRNPEALRSFVFAVAMNTARMELRRRKVRRWVHLTDSGNMPELAENDTQPEVRIAARRLYTHLDKLSISERECFVLRHLEGFELTEVAAATDLSLATVKRRLDRAQVQVLAWVAGDPFLAEYLDGGKGS